MIHDTTDLAGYKIGTAAKMVGISPNTIRTWMRRDYFSPSMGTDSGERILSQEDVRRLVLLKGLIDLGDSIGRIARLDDEALERRLSDLKDTADNEFANKIPNLTELRAALVSSRESSRLQSVAHFFWKSANYETLQELNEDLSSDSQISIVLIDYQGRSNDEKEAVLELARQQPEIAIVLLFDYIPRGTLQQFSEARIHLLRWPVNSIMMERFLYGILPTISAANQSEPADTIPDRLFSESQLSAITDSQPELDCDCPRHMSTIVASLSSFETYSENCANATEKDAKLHSYLHRETAKARIIMERALLHLCKEDGIPIPPR